MKDNTGKEYQERPPLKQPDPSCKHENFSARVDCNRLAKSDSPNATPHLFTAELSVKCEKCGGDFMFDGLPWMISLRQPCVNVTQTTAELPIRPWDGTLRSGTCVVEIPK